MSSRIAGGCTLVLLGTGAVVALSAIAPGAGILTLWGVGYGALVWAVSRPVKIDNLPEPVEDPIPSPGPIGRDDYVSPDGRRIYRKRAVGYAVEHVKAPADGETSPGRADC